jgi:peroxiredoxin
MIGVIGLVVIVVVSVLQLLTHGRETIGVAPGHRLHLFAAPLATSTLRGDPNPHPACTLARHDPRALNLCLLAARHPIVVSFFVPSAPACVRQVSALQTLSKRYPTVAFVAVAISAGQAVTARVVRRRRWTIPVAYDRDGTVQQLYGVVACPFVELAARGGIVRRRLIGNPWQTATSLSPSVRALASGA